MIFARAKYTDKNFLGQADKSKKGKKSAPFFAFTFSRFAIQVTLARRVLCRVRIGDIVENFAVFKQTLFSTDPKTPVAKAGKGESDLRS